MDFLKDCRKVLGGHRTSKSGPVAIGIGSQFLLAALVAGMLFLLIVWIFIPLGQTVSRQMDLAPSSLSAYSWNLFGSLMGILAFLGIGRMMLPPWFWLGDVLVGILVAAN